MKKRVLWFFCLLVISEASMAQLNGVDDFNDNTQDTNKWEQDPPYLLSETNGRLEYHSAGTGEEQGVWAWILNFGKNDRSWAATIDAYNALNPYAMVNQYGHIALAVVKGSDPDNNSFAVGLETGGDGEFYRGVFGVAEADGNEVFENGELVWANPVTLRISFDAGTRTLSGSYSEGDNFATVATFDVSAWNMTTNDLFVVAIVGGSSNLAVASDPVYADNFRAGTSPAISNHLSFVVINKCYDYDAPFDPGDNRYEFDVEATTDDTVTNVTFTTPAHETLQDFDRYLDAGSYVWEYNTNSLSSLSGRFGDGDYIVTLTYSNGMTESTIIPFAEEDGVTPLQDMSTQPLFSAPDPLQNALYSPSAPSSSSTDITLEWENIDPQANMFDIWLSSADDDYGEELGLFADHIPFATGPLSTRTVGPVSITQNVWEVEFFFGNATYQTNSDGVVYAAVKGAESDYVLTVLNPLEDEDADGIPNWWESFWFDGPTNCVASEDLDNDGHAELDEYITGMNPDDPASCFRITNCAPCPAGFIIEWPAIAERVYNVYRASDLLTGDSLPLETNILYPRNSCTDTVHNAAGQSFYRMDVRIGQ